MHWFLIGCALFGGGWSEPITTLPAPEPTRHQMIISRIEYEVLSNVLILFYFHQMDDRHDTGIPPDFRRGRGANANPANRYDRLAKEPLAERWTLDGEGAGRTNISYETPHSAIAYNKSPDISFDRSINPYRGCEHGCIYCFARPSHAYLGLSPGLDFERQLIARPGIAEVLRKELAAKKYNVAPMAIGTNTDPYQPVEKQHAQMREILSVLRETNHPVGIVTKGSLIERDIDLIAPMAAKGLARVGISITTLDSRVSRAMEPRVPGPRRRLETIRRLSRAGIPVRVMIAPVIPGLTDHELEPIMKLAAEAGAVAVSTIQLRLPQEVAPLFEGWLQEHFPDRAKKVLGRVREVHGGKLYDARWGHRFRGQGVWADLLRKRVKVAAHRYNLAQELPELRTDLFTAPKPHSAQMELF